VSVVIDIAAQFTGQKAFKSAENAADRLGRNVKRALIGVGVTAFAKSAITAFAQQEKQLEIFKNSLRNIGFAFATNDSLAFLNSLKLQFGVVDEQLLPAYQQLLATTKSLGGAQNLTNLALNLAANQGISVTEAANALSKAYLGNTKSLGALKLGISKTTLASGDFAKIIKEIGILTSGAAAAGADTFAGKLARIKVATDQAKESIGKGLVNALLAVSSSTDIEQLQTKIISFGESARVTFENIGKYISENIGLLKAMSAVLISTFVATKLVAGIAAVITAIQTLTKAYKALRASAAAAAIASMFALNPLGAAAMAAGMVVTIGLVLKSLDMLVDKAVEAQRTIAEVAGFTDTLNLYGSPASIAATKAAKLAKDTLDLKKKELKAAQDAAKLKRAQTLFDIDNIQIIAALQRNITEDERLRLNLQLALLTKNVDEADRLSQELLMSQTRTTGLALVIANLPKALNPFEAYPKYIQDAIDELAKLAEAQRQVNMWTMIRQQNAQVIASKVPLTQQNAASVLSSAPAALNEYQAITGEMASLGVRNMGSLNITVNNAGNVVSDADLVDQIRNGLLNSNLSGSPSAIGRLLGAFQ
jgi:hypothetical protein